MARIVITERDQKTIKQLAKYRFLTTTDIQAMEIYPSYAVTSNRIRKLRGAGYIDTFYTDRLSEGIHQLTKQGRELSFEEYGVEPQGTRVANYSSHFAGVSSILMRLESINLIDSFTREYTPGTKEYKFQIDASCQIFDTNCFIEYDSGLASIQFFKPKIKAWEDYKSSDAWKQHFQEFPHILILADRKEQIKNLIVENHKQELPYLISRIGDFMDDPMGYIWEYPNGERVCFNDFKKASTHTDSSVSGNVSGIRFRNSK